MPTWIDSEYNGFIEFITIWRIKLHVLNRTLKEYGFDNIMVSYNTEKLGFKCFAKPYSKEHVAVLVYGATPIKAIHNILTIHSDVPEIENTMEFYSQPKIKKNMRKCLDDAASKMDKIDFECCSNMKKQRKVVEMPVRVDKEFKDYWNPAVSIFNNKLKEYGFNLEIRYGDGIRDFGFKLYVTPDEGRAVAVADGVSPWNLIHNIYYIRNGHPRVKDYICLYQSPAGLHRLDRCLRDINSGLEKIGFKVSQKYSGR